jgi:hypothetical protein
MGPGKTTMRPGDSTMVPGKTTMRPGKTTAKESFLPNIYIENNLLPNQYYNGKSTINPRPPMEEYGIYA